MTRFKPATVSTCPPRCNECRLRKTGGFMPDTPQELAFIQGYRSATSSLPARATLIHEHAPNGKLFTLYAGWAFRYKTLSDGRRQILNFLLPGDFIGLQQEFAGTAVHGVEALTDIALCEFPRDGLWDLFRSFPNLGYDITWLATREEGIVDSNLLSVGKRTAMERIAALLLHLYRRLDRLGLVDNGSVAFPVSQLHIADNLGLSLVHTNKTLKRLSVLGLHELRDGRLWLHNPRALQTLADYYDAPVPQVPLL